MNYYTLNIGDYAAKTLHLSWEEDLAYRRLLGVYYLTERPLPLDVTVCQRLCSALTQAQQDAVTRVLKEFFTKQPDGWHQARADEELAKLQSRAEIAKANALKRWGAPSLAPKTPTKPKRSHRQSSESPTVVTLGANDRDASALAQSVNANGNATAYAPAYGLASLSTGAKSAVARSESQTQSATPTDSAIHEASLTDTPSASKPLVNDQKAASEHEGAQESTSEQQSASACDGNANPDATALPSALPEHVPLQCQPSCDGNPSGNADAYAVAMPMAMLLNTEQSSLRSDSSNSTLNPLGLSAARATHVDKFSTSETAANAVALAKEIRRLGMTSCNASHPGFLSLVANGLTIDECRATVAQAVAAGKPFNYLVAAIEGKRRDATQTSQRTPSQLGSWHSGGKQA